MVGVSGRTRRLSSAVVWPDGTMERWTDGARAVDRVRALAYRTTTHVVSASQGVT